MLITLSLCMIVKNEEKHLGRVLASAAPAADEIIIADTGSSDRTKDIARAWGARVFDVPWNDSFSDARNFSFSKASMDYCMWLDADDFLPPDSCRALMDLKETMPPKTHIVMLPYACGMEENGTPSLIYYRERIIKNHAGFIWCGPVHECIAPRGNIIYGSAVIEHHPQAGRDHTMRNLAIYEKAIKNGADLGPRDHFYYARELMAAGRFEAAIPRFIQVIYTPQAWKENRIEACKNLAECFLAQQQTGEALEALFKSFAFDTPRAEILCLLGDIFREMEDYPQAIYWYRRALECKEDPKSGAFIQKDCYGYYPCVCLCLCCHACNDLENAWRYHKKSGQWHTDTPEYLHNEAYFQTLR